MECQIDIDAKNTHFEECLVTLRKYKSLSESIENHKALLEERNPILYPATLLEESNPIIVNLSLDILENFISRKENHQTILSTFGILEALESLSLRKRKNEYELSRRAENLVELLRSSAPPAYGTRSRAKIPNQNKTNVYLLEIERLKKANIKNLERVLVKTKGLISFLTDLERKRCTIRLCQNISIQSIVKQISNECNMVAMIVTKDSKSGEEVLEDVLGSKMEKISLEYDEDEEERSFINNKAIAKTINLVKKGNGLLKSVADFWNESFYW